MKLEISSASDMRKAGKCDELEVRITYCYWYNNLDCSKTCSYAKEEKIRRERLKGSKYE